MSETLDYVSLIMGISATIAIVYLVIDLVGRHAERKRFNQMTHDLRCAILTSSPDWSELKAMAETHGYCQVDAARAMTHLQREIMVGRDEEMGPKLEDVRSHIERYRGDKPFEDINQEIRIHLERLRDRYPKSSAYLEPLANQIKELLTLKSQQMRRQRLIMHAGLIIGLAGVILGAVPYLSESERDSTLSDRIASTSTDASETSKSVESREAESDGDEAAPIDSSENGVDHPAGRIGEGLSATIAGVP